ncbi:MAG TPA: sugar transferase [Clostridia bacterium]|nr:sugar transferase [Clostridia bacterium]
MFDNKTQQVRDVTLLFDIGVIVGSFLLAYLFRHLMYGSEPGEFFSHAALLPLILSIWSVLLPYFGAYKSPRETSEIGYLWSITRAVGAGVALLLTLLFLLKITYVSRAVIIGFAGICFVLLSTVRIATLVYFRRSLRRGLNLRNVLIIGTGNRALKLSKSLREAVEWGVHVVGHLDPDVRYCGSEVAGSPVLGSVADITSVLKHHVVDDVILAVPRAMIPDVDAIARACEEEGVRLEMMADVFDVHVARMKLVHMGSVPLLTLEPVAQDEWMLIAKRAIDLGFCILIMPVLLPLLCIIAIAVRLDSPGPILFRQERVGFAKRRFEMLKFRTMVADAERLQAELEHLNEAEGPIFKIKNDPRITRVGGFLRRTSLDELPQFLNVFRGEMSLVGPRPMSIRDVDLFDKGVQRKRFSVKPGLTCLWQVSGRSNLPFSKWLELDLQYINNWSLALDLKILFRTIPAVLRGSGAV